MWNECGFGGPLITHRITLALTQWTLFHAAYQHAVLRTKRSGRHSNIRFISSTTFQLSVQLNKTPLHTLKKKRNIAANLPSLFPERIVCPHLPPLFQRNPTPLQKATPNTTRNLSDLIDSSTSQLANSSPPPKVKSKYHHAIFSTPGFRIIY